MVEQSRGVGAERRTAGEHPDIRINTGRNVVVISRGKMKIAPDAVPLFREIGMHCMGCAMANTETLDEACQAHNVDTNELLAKLNQGIQAVKDNGIAAQIYAQWFEDQWIEE